MEAVYKKFSPQQKGWYLGLKQDDTPFAFYVPRPQKTQYVITIPWDFSKNPNYGHVFDPNTWVVVETDKASKTVGSWAPLKQILPLENCIDNNIELEMEYRKSLVGRTIKIEDIEYLIVDMHHHHHAWTIYNISNKETSKSRQIQLQNYDDWSFGGIDKIEVEILNL
jgi:hypothetical protein